MNISDQGIDFICSFEGFSAKPYPDPATHGEPYTIGYGTTHYPNGQKVTLDDPIVTEEEAKGYVANYIAEYISDKINELLPRLTQTQFDALCSFCYNLGVGSLRTSSLLSAIKANASNEEITTDFSKWDKADGRVMAGLLKRRVAEANLYCNGIYAA